VTNTHTVGEHGRNGTSGKEESTDRCEDTSDIAFGRQRSDTGEVGDKSTHADTAAEWTSVTLMHTAEAPTVGRTDDPAAWADTLQLESLRAIVVGSTRVEDHDAIRHRAHRVDAIRVTATAIASGRMRTRRTVFPESEPILGGRVGSTVGCPLFSPCCGGRC
jgi:hypothetical protein